MQQDLFEGNVARNTDPVTSWEAGEEFKAKGKHRDHYAIILKVMRGVSGDMTTAEVSTWCELDRNQVARRMPEIERLGLVYRNGIKVCNTVKRRCIAWALKEKENNYVSQ